MEHRVGVNDPLQLHHKSLFNALQQHDILSDTNRVQNFLLQLFEVRPRNPNGKNRSSARVAVDS